NSTLAIWPSTRVRTVIAAIDSTLPTASVVIGAGRFSLTAVRTGTVAAAGGASAVATCAGFSPLPEWAGETRPMISAANEEKRPVNPAVSNKIKAPITTAADNTEDNADVSPRDLLAGGASVMGSAGVTAE